jgi:hypothetical protein
MEPTAPRARTYCNPLPIPAFAASQRGCVGPQSLADPAVIAHEGKWYLFASAAQAWVSDDLVDWHYHEVPLPRDVIGPAIERYGEHFYLAGNGCASLFRAPHPLGPWEDLGPIHDRNGQRVHWADLYFFNDRTDDGADGTFYCYHNSGHGIGTDGIWVTPLDPATNFTRAAAESVNCFAYDPAHVWERWGDANEFPDVAWIEAPCVIKHAGRYHLSYSGCGSEWRRYAVGAYASDRPTGPWTYDERSPLLKDLGGMLNGTGHHAMTIGPDGGWWMIYHVLVAQNHKFDRRLALDPVEFDSAGRMHVRGPTETPQFAPGAAADRMRANDPGLVPLTINKPAECSSHAPGRTPNYAVDHYIRTWWEPSAPATPLTSQWLLVDLQGTFAVEACRLIFSMAGGPRAGEHLRPYRYRLEVSDDARAWRVATDRTNNDTPRAIEYAHFPPARGRYVRLSLTAAPSDRPLGVIDFTAFGRA